MSLPADIIQLIGTSSVPVVVAGSVLGVFELGERLASQRAKDALSTWLLSFDVQRAKALPDGTQELFDRIFGKRHFSLKCFIRSVMFSLGAMAFVGILSLLISPRESLSSLRTYLYFSSTQTRYLVWSMVGLWLPWSIIIDYVSLFKTRVILRILAQIRFAIVAPVILCIDLIAYRLLFVIGLESIYSSVLILDTPEFEVMSFIASYFIRTVIGDFLQSSIIPIENYIFKIFFVAGFAPSIWMWLYVAALFVTRGLLRSERIVTWLRWFLDIEKSPFRSIGAVAAVLAFIASIAILLISAAIFRISAAA